MLSFYPSFFFQAEDGIRDGHVTGVQTCALPIFTPNISLIPFPGAIIGLTFSSLITRQSITTGPSCANASSNVDVKSASFETRIPRTPKLSANFTKSGLAENIDSE